MRVVHLVMITICKKFLQVIKIFKHNNYILKGGGMKARYVLWIGGIFVFLCLIVGCQTSTSVKQEEPNSTAIAEEEAIDTEEEQNEEILDPSMFAAGSAEQVLRQLEAEKSLEQQQQETFIQHLIATAKNKIAQHEYQTAKEFLDQALKIQPNHEEASELRGFVGTYLGELDAQTTTLHDMYVNEVKVKMEQAKLEAKNHYKRANEYIAQQKYDLATTELEHALEILTWLPMESGMDHFREQIQEKIQETKKLSEEYLAEERQAKIDEARRQAEAFEEKEMAQRASRIRMLLERATEFYTRQQYEKSESLVKQVLKDDPSNRIAKQLLKDIHEASHSLLADKTLQRRMEEWKIFLEDMKKSSIPITDLILYPDKDYWHNVISKRKNQTDLNSSEKSDKGEESPIVQDIKSKLETVKITLNFADTPFEDVIRYIHTVASINIVVDPKVIQNFEIDGTRVTLQVNSLKLQDALQILLSFHDLVYLFKDDVLFITSKDSDLAKGKAIPVLHDIRDLTGQIKDFAGPKIRLMSETGESTRGAQFEEQEEETQAVLTGEKLTELIKGTIEPDSWEDEQYSVAETSGQLLVVHTEEVQNEIRTFLNDMRRFQGMMVAMESRFITVTDDFLEHVGIDWRGIGEEASNQAGEAKKWLTAPLTAVSNAVASGNDKNSDNNLATSATTTNPSAGLFFKDTSQTLRMRTENVDQSGITSNTRLKTTGGIALQVATLNDTELNAVVWLLKKTGRSEVLMAPRLTAFNTQRASLTVVDQRSYIKDFDVEVAQSAYIADPQMGTLQTGIVLDVRPTISNDRKYITLEVRPTITTLGDLKDFSTSLGGAQMVNLSLPIVDLQSVETTVRIPDQGTLLLGGLKSYTNNDAKLDIPILGDIPVIGFFFSQRTKSEEQRDLIILIKAKIIDLEEEEEKAVGIRK